MLRAIAGAVLALGMASAATAAEPGAGAYSKVYQAPGQDDVAELARRAQTCLARDLHGTTVNEQVIRSVDLPGGVVVASSAFGVGSIEFRSVLTFEAKPGRFRITQDGIEAFYYSSWKPSDGRLYHDRFESLNDKIASCVTQNAGDKTDW